MANSNITVLYFDTVNVIFTSFSTVWLLSFEILLHSTTTYVYWASSFLFFSRKHAVGLDLAKETLKSWFCSEIRSDNIYFFDIIIRWSFFFKQRQVQFSKIWPIFDFSNDNKKLFRISQQFSLFPRIKISQI